MGKNVGPQMTQKTRMEGRTKILPLPLPLTLKTLPQISQIAQTDGPQMQLRGTADWEVYFFLLLFLFLFL